MDADAERLLVELIEKVGLLKRDLQHRKDLEKYEARVARIDQKLAALISAVSADNAALGKALETAWKQPARSLAFRNVAHQKGDE
jgi:hypothetical protein